MINRHFIPYNLAVKLKKLGFNDSCIAYWQAPSKLGYCFNHNSANGMINDISAPLYEQVFNWFREEYGLHPNILSTITDSWRYEICRVVCKLDYPYISGERSLDERAPWNGDVLSRYEYSQYEQARLACLEKLIEIVHSEK